VKIGEEEKIAPPLPPLKKRILGHLMNETEKAEFDSLMTSGVPLGLLTFLVALTRIIVRVLYSVVFGVCQDSATLTEPTPTPQSSRT